jgi:hypothetical protein
MVAVFLIVCMANAAYARGPYGSVAVAGWSGGAFTDDKTGKFLNCIASASYKSGINVGVLVSETYHWALGFTYPGWALTPDQKFPIVLSFDGRNTFNVVGVAASRTTVLVQMPQESALIRSFRAARTTSAFAQGNLFQFNLDGTTILLPSLVNCVKAINSNGIAAATNFTVVANVTPRQISPTTPSSPPTAASSLQPDRPQEGSAELQLEAMQIASNFILKASSLSHPSLLSGSDAPVSLGSTGAAWRADNATGFVRIVPPKPNQVGLDVAAAVVGNDAKNCKGKFASARNSELIDSEVVFRGMSSCEDSEGSAIAEYFILPRRAGGFVIFSVVTPTKAIGPQIQPQNREEVNAGFRKAAYTAAGQ